MPSSRCRRRIIGSRLGSVALAERVIDVRDDGQPLERLALPSPFAQHAGELAIREQHVIGPLEFGQRPADELVHHVGEHQAGANRHRARLGARRTEQHRYPGAPPWGMPGPATPAAPGRLLLGHDHRSGRRSLRAQVVDGVEARRQPPEDAALRHAPPLREHSRGNAVEP